MAYETTRVSGVMFRKRVDLPQVGGPGGYHQFECECGAVVNGAGLSTWNHARSRKHRDAMAKRVSGS